MIVNRDLRSLDSGKFAEKVQRDMMDGRKLGINGKRISDNSYESVKAAIEAALKSGTALKSGNGK